MPHPALRTLCAATLIAWTALPTGAQTALAGHLVAQPR